MTDSPHAPSSASVPSDDKEYIVDGSHGTRVSGATLCECGDRADDHDDTDAYHRRDGILGQCFKCPCATFTLPTAAPSPARTAPSAAQRMTDYRAGYSTGWSDTKDGLSVQRDAAASLLWLGQSSPGDELPPKAKPFLDRSEAWWLEKIKGEEGYVVSAGCPESSASSEPSSASRKPTESFAELMSENSVLQHRVETLTAALSEENRGKSACYDCGLAYGEDGWIECVIPNDVWRQIGPTGHDGGLLCITCIARRAKRAGLAKVPAMLCGTEAIRVADQEEAFNRGWDCAESALKELRAELDSLRSERAADRQDAERWRAFIGSSRIRFFGTAGPDANGYAHFGGEFWTGVPADRFDAQTHATTRANAEWLVKYADAARTPALPETSNG